ncbi:MAG: hypothetical protein NVSMB17_03330 [Candidatus Dormibacteria bacterium]
MADTGNNLPPGAGAPLVAGPPRSLIVHQPGTAAAYLYSRKNLAAASIAVVVGVVLLLTGIVGLLWPVAALGAYVIAAIAVPAPRAHHSLASPQAEDVRAALAAQARALTGRVSTEVYGKVAAVQATILELLPRVEHLSAASQDLYVVQRTALEYLPAALDAYLSLPRAYATVHRVEGGKTPSQVLLEQLDLLQVKLAEISDDIASSDSDRLLANGRFLREKFGGSELDTPRLTSTTAPPPPPA